MKGLFYGLQWRHGRVRFPIVGPDIIEFLEFLDDLLPLGYGHKHGLAMLLLIDDVLRMNGDHTNVLQRWRKSESHV